MHTTLRQGVPGPIGTARWLAGFCFVLCLAGCEETSSSPASTDNPAERAWITEAEILADPSLEITPQQVVILHLGATRLGDPAGHHVIPYRFAEETTYNFCIPDEEEHIHSAELFERGEPTPLFQLVPGGGCETRTIEPGSYLLVVQHDGRGIPDEGRKAFIHVPRLKEEARSPVAGTGAQAAVSPGGLSVCNALAVLTTADGKFLVRGSGSPYPSVATATSVDLATGGWQVCRDANGAYAFFLPTPQTLQNNQFGPQAMYAESNGHITVHNDSVLPYATPLDLVDLGDFQFLFSTAAFANAQAIPANPIVVASDGTLRWTTTGSSPVYGIPIKYYLPGVEPPPLQMGEVSLQHSCNTSHGTWVVRANTPDAYSIIYNNPQLGTHEYLSQSTSGILVRVGPDTVASFYAATGYRGLIENIGGDVCGTDFDDFGSMKITTARDFIIANNYCRSCNLTGVDLSGLDLTNGFYKGSTFSGANLSNTNLTLADLDSANISGPDVLLSGADFTDAVFLNTSFRGADLSEATALSSEGLFASFGERADLTGATLDVGTFLPSDWKYLNLTGAIIRNAQCRTNAGQCVTPCNALSSSTNRVDFSGAILNSVDLGCALLDGAIFDCDTSEGDPVCTQLIDTNLNRASLKAASFVNANLQGAHLDFANLDSANLCSANLNESPDQGKSASLQGAYLRNVNLYQADLTGASLDNSNFYSTDTSGICNGASCGPTKCSTAANATLNRATFTHAYLSGTDFSDASGKSVDFTDAFLMGANFTKANLSKDGDTGSVVNFRGSYLQGANMSTASSVSGANFNTAYIDTRSGSATVKLEADNTKFTGFTPSSTPAAGCIKFTYPNASATPRTDNTNTCPNGSTGSSTSGCGSSQWVLPTPTPGCSSIDFNWGAIPTALPTLTPTPQ